ncbi:MAG: aldehyde dehydrogenase family protein [Saprospiraceae bacterium]
MKSFRSLSIKSIHGSYYTGIKQGGESNSMMHSYSPVDGSKIGSVKMITREEYDHVTQQAVQARLAWRNRPAPARGEIVRQMGDAFRKNKKNLGALVSYEMGKSLQEGLGEVQEIIDICDFAVGLSRQLYGLTMHSERSGHRMYEQWHPLGTIGIISAFNFPVAVWSWNAMIGMVCGNTVVWKPSEKTPLCAVAVMNIIGDTLKNNNVEEGVINLIQGDYRVGQWMAEDSRFDLISATGSTRMGKAVASVVAARLGKSLLELGGNNAIIITPSSETNKVIAGAVFGAIGTAGQRCTSTRRLIIHHSIYNKIIIALKKAYNQIKIGNPLDVVNHVGPLIDIAAVNAYLQAIEEIKKEGGRIITPYGVLSGKGYESGCYVMPCIAVVSPDFKIVQKETFAPILYVMKYDSLADAIAIQNNVPQGLSSAIMSNDLKETEYFLSVNGSDCGIANVNIGTSGAEIGGAFGGEKETGGGRESGSDAWKAYMRRQTNTINYSGNFQLAQGIVFDI